MLVTQLIFNTKNLSTIAAVGNGIRNDLYLKRGEVLSTTGGRAAIFLPVKFYDTVRQLVFTYPSDFTHGIIAFFRNDILDERLGMVGHHELFQNQGKCRQCDPMKGKGHSPMHGEAL